MAFVPALSINHSFRHRSPALQQASRTRFHANNRVATRMIATEPVVETVTTTKLSDLAITLNSYIRGHKSVFLPMEGFTATTSNLFKKNDTARIYTPLNELETNEAHLPGRRVAAVMFSQQSSLLDIAFEAAETHMPTALTDKTITDILRYNFTALLRAISYGAACQSTHFVHSNNIGIMNMLHHDVGISAQAVSAALTAVKDAVLAEVSDDESVVAPTTACFDVVIDALA